MYAPFFQLETNLWVFLPILPAHPLIFTSQFQQVWCREWVLLTPPSVSSRIHLDVVVICPCLATGTQGRVRTQGKADPRPPPSPPFALAWQHARRAGLGRKAKLTVDPSLPFLWILPYLSSLFRFCCKRICFLMRV